MIYLEHNENDLFVLSQKILACMLSEMQEIPKKVGILMFVEPLGRGAGLSSPKAWVECPKGVSKPVSKPSKPSFFVPGFQRQVSEHLREIISDDRRLSRLAGMDIEVTVKANKQFTKPNVIGLGFNFS